MRDPDRWNEEVNAMLLVLWGSLVLGFVALTLIFRLLEGCWFWER